MFANLLDDLVRIVSQAVPAGARELQRDMEKNVRALFADALNRVDLVTREEFDIQAAVLARTRAKVESLERQVAALEAQALAERNTKAEHSESPPAEGTAPAG
jgi:BMFP domain-containing protein YqiC